MSAEITERSGLIWSPPGWLDDPFDWSTRACAPIATSTKGLQGFIAIAQPDSAAPTELSETQCHYLQETAQAMAQAMCVALPSGLAHRPTVDAHALLVQVQQQIFSLDVDLAQILALVVDTARMVTQAQNAQIVLLEPSGQWKTHAATGQNLLPVGTQMDASALPYITQLTQGPVHSRLPPPDFGVQLALPIHLRGKVEGALVFAASHSQLLSEQTTSLQSLCESLGALLQLRRVGLQLQDSEHLYQQLFEHHPQPMWVYAQDDSLRLLAVNQAMVARYGYTAQELLRMSMHDLWLDEDRATLQAEVTALPLEHQRSSVLRRHRHKDGHIMDVEISAQGLIFNGQPARQSMATDVTQRLRTERELARLARAHQLISACNETVIRSSNETDLLQAVCRIVVDIGGYRVGWVGYARDNAKRSIDIVAHAGHLPDYLDELDLSWDSNLPAGQGPSGITVRSGHSVIIPDVRHSTQFRVLCERMQAQGFFGVITLPLRYEERCIGLLFLYAPEVLHISPQEVHLLQNMADDLGFGISSLRARQAQLRLHTCVMRMAQAVSASAGTEFFDQLTYNLAEMLDASAAVVVRFIDTAPGTPRRAQLLAASPQGLLQSGLEYALDISPSSMLLVQPQCVISRDVLHLYPDTPIVRSIQAQAYVGQQLTNAQGRPMGAVFVLFQEPLGATDFILSTLQIFATRAAAELDRQQADAHIRRQASLLDKAQDAILVLELDQRISYWNQGAENLYGWSRVQAEGWSMQHLLRQENTSFESTLEHVLQHGEWSGELQHHHIKGYLIDIEARWTLVRDEQGQPESILAIHSDIGQRKSTERQIHKLAFYDALTGLPNRMLLMERMQQALQQAQRRHQGGALLFIDLDHFKTLNDTLGHDKGDLLLKQVAGRLQTCVRATDTVARVGGDEFVVMLEGLDIEPQALAIKARSIGEKILLHLASSYELAGYQYRSTPSLGIAPFGDEEVSVGELLQQADLAMYQAKTAGRNTLRFFDPRMQAVVTARAALEADLRNALGHNQLLLYYQPQADYQGRWIGVEALVRWQHPERGMVSPGEFIPLAEETGQILALGQWVLHTACLQLAQWRDDPNMAHLSVAVNVSSHQFHHAGFVKEIHRTLQETQAPAHLLKLELTESQLVEDMDTTIATMQALRTLGVGFSLDDFGTGYSSLAYLKRMPLLQLKIDQSFVQDLLNDPNDAAIVNTIIGLSRSLGLQSLAEGVETAEQREALLQAGCHALQGYHLGRPATAASIEQLITQRPTAF